MAAIGNKVGLGHRAPVASAHGPESGVRCDWGAARYTGSASARSEDAWQAEPEAGVFAFAEGLGGYNAGDVASAIAVRRLAEGLGRGPEPGSNALRRRLLLQQVRAANAAIHLAASRQPQSRGMATSLSCLWIGPRGLVLGHVGHSEIWLVRSTAWQTLNRPCRDGAVPSRLLGVEADIEVESSVLAWEAGDRVVLCSSGTGNRIGLSRLAAIVRQAADATDCATAVIDAARTADSLDNVAALVVFVTDARPCVEEAIAIHPGHHPGPPLSAPDRAV